MKTNKKGSTRPVGRPTLYDPTFCESVENGMGRGLSLTAWAGEIGASRRVINDWMAAHFEFLHAVERAKAKRALYWENQAKRVAERGGGPGTAQVLVLMLRNAAPAEYGADRRADVRIPSIDGAKSAMAAIAEAAAAFARGEIDVSHAEAIASMARAYIGAAEIAELEARLAALESER